MGNVTGLAQVVNAQGDAQFDGQSLRRGVVFSHYGACHGRIGIATQQAAQHRRIDPKHGRCAAGLVGHSGHIRHIGLLRWLDAHGQPAREGILQQEQFQRLGQVFVHSCGSHAHSLAAQGVGCQGQDGNARGVFSRMLHFMPAHGLGKAVAVHAGHVQIGQQQRITSGAPEFQRLDAVFSNFSGVAEHLDLAQDDQLIDLVVLGDEDETTLRAGFRHGGRPHRCTNQGLARTFIRRDRRIPAGSGSHCAHQHRAAQAVALDRGNVQCH